jgi:hypothetical protein
MKEILERLLKENIKMINESGQTGDENYQIGYLQALLNMKALLEYELNELK